MIGQFVDPQLGGVRCLNAACDAAGRPRGNEPDLQAHEARQARRRDGESAHLVSRQNATRRATIIRLSSQIEELTTQLGLAVKPTYRVILDFCEDDETFYQ